MLNRERASYTPGLDTLWNPECPWYSLRSSLGLPNADWCEKNRCSWVAEPSNTWSNLAYLVIASLVYYYMSKNMHQIRNTLALKIAPVAMLMGTFSLVYHASITWFFQFFDFFGMFLYILQLSNINLVRLGVLSSNKERIAYFLQLSFWSGVVLYLRSIQKTYQFVVVLTIAFTLVLEAVIRLKHFILAKILARKQALSSEEGQISSGYLLLTLGLLSIAVYFSFIDISRRWCDPDSILQGTSLTHL